MSRRMAEMYKRRQKTYVETPPSSRPVMSGKQKEIKNNQNIQALIMQQK